MEPEEIKLAQYINELSVSHVKFTKLGEDISQANNQAKYVVDSLASSVINRTIQLTQGYVTLVNTNNYIAAIPLIRIQLDNALRFFSIFQVTDPNDFVLYFMDAKPVYQYKSHTGEKLSDSYLAKKLDDIFPGIFRLYKETCDYVHLSRQHVHASKYFDAEGKVRLQVMDVNKGIDAFSLEAKINFAYNMLEVGKLIWVILDKWKQTKQSFPIPDPATARSLFL